MKSVKRKGGHSMAANDTARSVTIVVTAESLLGVIREKCLECCGGCKKTVEGCNSQACPCWPYRMGKSLVEEPPPGKQEKSYMSQVPKQRTVPPMPPVKPMKKARRDKHGD